MTTDRDKRRGRRAGLPARQAGFTLLELLTVILIIGLLLSILMPSINVIISSVYATRTLARIKGLEDGANAYKGQYSYFPGQLWSKNPPDGADIYWPDQYTGSQVLAACMYGYSYGQIDSPVTWEDANGQWWLSAGRPKMKPLFAPLKTDIWDKDGTREKIPQSRAIHTASGKHNTLLDEFPFPLPILYYPFRIGKTVVSEAYVYNDNDVYVEDPDVFNDYRSRLDKPAGYSSADYAVEMKLSFENNFGIDSSFDPPRLRNEGGFLIIAPGADRLYFTVDDKRHWP